MSKQLPLGRRILFSVLITLIAGGFVLIVLELGVARYYSQEASDNFIRFDPSRGWALISGSYWVKPVHRFSGFNVTIDDRGLRAHSHPYKRRRGGTVVVLGDSFTFARETPTDKLFTQQLQTLLDKGGRDIGVVNAGVPGYGTAQELLLLKQLGEQHRLRADVVILVFFTNDILDNLCLSYGNLIRQRIRPCFAVDATGRAVLQSQPEKVLERGDDTLVAASPGGGGLKSLAVARNMTEAWLQTQPSLVKFLGRVGVDANMTRMPALLNGWYRDDVVRVGTPLTAALIREVDQQVRVSGGRLIVTMVPSPLQVYPETYLQVLRKSFPDEPVVGAFGRQPLRPQELVRDMSRGAQVTFHDLMPFFRSHNGQTLFIPRDGHLNDAGHGLVAEALCQIVGEALSGLSSGS
jgi:lysophospholipase L1-like esterase